MLKFIMDAFTDTSGMTHEELPVDCSTETFNFILQRLESSNCVHIIDSIISHLDQSSFNNLAETNSFYKYFISKFMQNIFQKRKQLWLDRENKPIVSIKDSDLYYNPDFSTNFPASMDQNVQSVSVKKLATDCVVTWLDTRHGYLLTENDEYLNRKIVALKHVCWLHLKVDFEIEINMLKNLLHRFNGVISVQGGWRMDGSNLPYSRYRNFPQIGVSCLGKNSKQNFFSSDDERDWNIEHDSEHDSSEYAYESYQTDFFKNSEHYKTFAKSPSIILSIGDLIEAETSGKSKICVTLEYNDTVDGSWKRGLKWSYAEIMVGGI